VAGRYARDYYEASAPPLRSSVESDLPAPQTGCLRRARTPGLVPTFTMRSIGQGGARLYPGSIAMATPQTFTMASPPTELNGFGVEDHAHQLDGVLVRCVPARIHQV
jgi:hypothetical protein